MNSAEATTIANFLLADFAREMQTTEHVLAAVPDKGLSYSPDKKSKTGLGLLRHIVLEDEWVLNSVAAGSFNSPPDDSDVCGIMNAADAVTRYKEKLPAALDRVRAMSGAQLTANIDMFGMMQMPAVSFLALALKHSIHHRGQLSAYLRAMGGTVPNIYGPTAETQAAAAAH